MESEGKIFVVCPANAETGGPELLHQLCYTLCQLGYDALMLYYGYDPKCFSQPVPQRYVFYKNSYVTEGRDCSGDWYILPEVLPAALSQIHHAKKIWWWLSVDNYFSTQVRDLKSLPAEKQMEKAFSFAVELLNPEVTHFAQSAYAMDFCRRMGVKGRLYYLSDYLHPAFIDQAIRPADDVREDIVLYNPIKGYEFTKELIAKAPELQWVALQNLSAEEMAALLRRAKVYIDFGHHPGKDRIPREAAISGCCVITGRQGSAAFFEDVPIPDAYKFEDSAEKQTEILQCIREILAHYEQHIGDFAAYREKILGEEQQFRHDVRLVFDELFGRYSKEEVKIASNVAVPGASVLKKAEPVRNGNKIVIISMVKNEVDVIESFVRHALTVADQLLIVDHESSDGTGEVLAALVQEGLPVSVRAEHRAAQLQSEVMTELMREAFEAYGADVVLPLDADEFLVAESAALSCRKLLERLDTSYVYSLSWIRYVLQEPEREQERFLLARACRRERTASQMEKVVVGKQVQAQASVTIAQGNHLVLLNRPSGAEVLQPKHLQGLHIAHFPWRSQQQAMSKAANGWVMNVAKYSRYTSMANHWQRDFARLQRQEVLKPEPLEQECIEAAPLTAAAELSMIYTKNRRSNAFVNLLYTSEHLAQSYAEQGAGQQKKMVTILLPVLGDMAGFKKSLQSALAQTYPYKEIIICHTSADVMDELEQLLAVYAGDAVLRILEPEEPVENAGATGEFVQWIFPGDILVPEKVKQMVTALITQPELTFVMSNAVHDAAAYASAAGCYEDLPVGELNLELAAGRELWQYMLELGKCFSGGMSSIIFRRQTMEACHWMQESFVGMRILLFSCWCSVLEGSVIGVFHGPTLTVKGSLCCAEDIIWNQLEWFCMLEEYKKQPEILSGSVYRTAAENFCQQQSWMEELQPSVSAELYGQYKFALQQMMHVRGTR